MSKLTTIADILVSHRGALDTSEMTRLTAAREILIALQDEVNVGLFNECTRLQAELKAAKVFEASYRKHRGELLAELDRLTKLLRDVSKVSQSRVVRTMIDQRLKPARKDDE